MISNMLKRHSVRLCSILTALMLAGPACAADKADADNDGQAESRTTEAKSDVKENGVVDVYLFHGSYRCFSCNKMEELTLEAIDESFAEQKKNGTVKFKHVNVEEDGNRHFVQDYNIRAISIILSNKSGGEEEEWKNLDKVWMLLRNEEKFKEYITEEIKAYL